MLIKELLILIKDREVPTVRREDDIRRVIEIITRFPHARLIYVTDEFNRLQGTITVGSLLRHIFPHHYEGKIHPRGILRNITAKNAMHIMDREDIHATPGESVDTVLRRMAATGVKEMAVVDEQGVILSDITAIDLLKHYHLPAAGETTGPT